MVTGQVVGVALIQKHCLWDAIEKLIVDERTHGFNCVVRHSLVSDER